VKLINFTFLVQYPQLVNATCNTSDETLQMDPVRFFHIRCF